MNSNPLLASLPPEVTAVLAAHLEPVELATGETLHQAGTEVAVAGHEGVVGVCAFMGGGKALSSDVVQCPGLAWRMSARDIAELSRDHEPVMQQLLRYTQVLFTHMAQSSAFNRHPAQEPQLCRFLLQHIDRQAGDELRITHERIAGMLGVRREGVTGAAQNLQRTGLIRCRRGPMRVIDRLPRAHRHPGPQPRMASLVAPARAQALGRAF